MQKETKRDTNLNIQNEYQRYLTNFESVADVKTVNLSEKEAQKEYESFLAKVLTFKDIKTLEQAKRTAKDLFLIKDEINCIKAGNAKCVIIDRADTLRIVLDSDKDLICYNFQRK